MPGFFLGQDIAVEAPKDAGLDLTGVSATSAAS